MLSRYQHKGLTWIDLQSPTSDEVRTLMQEFGIHPLVAEELLSPTLKPKVERYPDFMYVILHFPAFKHTHGPQKNQEVDFVIGRDFLITTRYDTIDPLHKFSKVFEVNSILDRSDIGNHAGFLFFYMVRKLYRAVEHEFEYVANFLKDLEDRIFDGREKQVVRELSFIARELLSFRQALLPHKEILESFEISGRRFFGDDFSHHARAIIGEYYRVAKELEVLRDSLHELRTTNDSLLSTKQNRIMQGISVVAFIFLPISILMSLFQIDAVSRPIIGTPGDFWLITALMVTLALGLFVLFKWKKWI